MVSNNDDLMAPDDHAHNMKHGAIIIGRMVTALIAIMVLLMVAVAVYWTQVKGESLPIRFSVDSSEEASVVEE